MGKMLKITQPLRQMCMPFESIEALVLHTTLYKGSLCVPVDVTPFTKACIALLKQKSSSWQKPHHGKNLHHDHAMMAGSGHCEFEDQDDAGSGDADD